MFLPPSSASCPPHLPPADISSKFWLWPFPDFISQIKPNVKWFLNCIQLLIFSCSRFRVRWESTQHIGNSSWRLSINVNLGWIATPIAVAGSSFRLQHYSCLHRYKSRKLITCILQPALWKPLFKRQRPDVLWFVSISQWKRKWSSGIVYKSHIAIWFGFRSLELTVHFANQLKVCLKNCCQFFSVLDFLSCCVTVPHGIACQRTAWGIHTQGFLKQT